MSTLGGHDKESFSGTVIHTPDDRWDLFQFEHNWDISSFTPINEPITIKFIP